MYGVTMWIIADIERASGRLLLRNALKHMVNYCSFYFQLAISTGNSSLESHLHRCNLFESISSSRAFLWCWVMNKLQKMLSDVLIDRFGYEVL